jgi:hypothetical protein
MTRTLLRAYGARWIFILAFIVAAQMSVLFNAPVSVRTATVVPVFLVCPGLAIAGLVRFENAASALRLAVPISLAVSLVTAQILLTTGDFDSRLGLSIICTVCALALLGDRLLRRP